MFAKPYYHTICKPFLRLIVTMALSLGVSAQSFGTEVPNSLRSIPLEPLTNALGHFTQERLSPNLNITLKSKGTFSFTENHGFIWITEEPFVNARHYTDSGVWEYTPNQDTLSRTKKKSKAEKFSGKIIQSLVERNWKTLERLFEQDVTAHSDGFIVNLTPKNKRARKFIEGVVLNISSSPEQTKTANEPLTLKRYAIRFTSGELVKVEFEDLTNLPTGGKFLLCEPKIDSPFIEKLCLALESQ